MSKANYIWINLTLVCEGVRKKTHLLIKNEISTIFRLDTPRYPTFHVMGSKYTKNKIFIIFTSFFDHFLTKIYDLEYILNTGIMKKDSLLFNFIVIDDHTHPQGGGRGEESTCVCVCVCGQNLGLGFRVLGLGLGTNHDNDHKHESGCEHKHEHENKHKHEH